MARKPHARTIAHAPVRLSIALGADTHLRLLALALMRQTTLQAIVESLIDREVANVRLPSLGSSGGADDPA